MLGFVCFHIRTPGVGTGQEDRSLGTTKELMSAGCSSRNISGEQLLLKCISNLEIR